MTKVQSLARELLVGSGHTRISQSQRRRIEQLLATTLNRKGLAQTVPPYTMHIVYDPDDRIFVVTVPELPGCMTHGATHVEAARKGQDAIDAWIGVAREFGDPIPPPAVHRYALDPDPLDGEVSVPLVATGETSRARGVA